MLLLALLGCQDRAEQDRTLYAAVLSAPRPSRDALARCSRIRDAQLSGDCALAVVAASDAEPGSLCAEVPDGMWREECWFLAAEATNRAGSATEAAEMCQRAGRFALDCAQHLWQTPVHALIHGPGAAAFAEVLPRAEAMFAAWSPLMAEQTDFSDRFWAKFFGNGFEGQGPPVDLAWCDPVPDARREACVAAGSAHYAREIGPGVEGAGALEAMCALDAAGAVDVAALSPWVAAIEDPRLDVLSASRAAEICATHPHRQRR